MGAALAVAYVTDIPIDQTINAYAEYFNTHGVSPSVRKADSAVFDSSRPGLCMIVERWGEGLAFRTLESELSANALARLAAATGAYSIVVPDNCSFKG